MRPKILLSGKNKIEFYTDAVTGSGGDPYAAYLPKPDLSFDGLILCGGTDVHPKYFLEEIDGSVNIDTARDEAEFALAEAFIKAKKPVMGICRGCQLLNIFFGGSLYQHIATADSHTSFSDTDLVHSVTAVEGSLLHTLYGAEFSVNSAHHQAVKIPGDGLAVTARGADGVAEAFEHTALPVFGVQWHPERMSFSKRREDTVDGKILFEYFIELCKNTVR